MGCAEASKSLEDEFRVQYLKVRNKNKQYSCLNSVTLLWNVVLLKS